MAADGLATDREKRTAKAREYYYAAVEKFRALPGAVRTVMVLVSGYGIVALFVAALALAGGNRKHGLTDAVSAVSSGIKNGGYKQADRPGLCPEHYPFGMPRAVSAAGGKDLYYLCRYTFAAAYSKTLKAPLWTAEWVRPGQSEGGMTAYKPLSEWLPDKQVDAAYYVAKAALEKSRVAERGQMAAAENNRSDYWGNKDVSLVTNSAPQFRTLNRGAWRALETEIADRAADEKAHPQGLVVYTGPLYLGKKRLLSDKTPVPSHFYKIVIDRENGNSAAFVLPNADVPGYGKDGGAPKKNEKPDYRLDGYRVGIAQIERWSGINFNPLLKRETADRVEKGKGSLWLQE